MKSKPLTYSGVLLIILGLALILGATLITIKYHTAPCSKFKTDIVLQHGYAPARCTVEAKYE